ncbi:L,D-transpeptidase family protein [Pseudalkalibacillus salsuginis]|uniref:L,D-transpeptidase family protein n=1 Tax=Pseudalkalibacillus salsuginis TaxID=2910972 RepID=UPI001F009C85|nr:L,D-transpeptidase family protein [Pseudalkalibacillus salsuginis]MCF6409871.1 L,D-transpeptidase family protein [Pseudalkalibacillus salsuginis]
MKTGLKKIIVGLLVFGFMFFFVHQPASASSASYIIINKSNNQLAYFENNQLIKVFHVATGKKPSYTPEGRFKVVNKIVNRPYYTGKIPGGDPRNPLGNRWLGLNARGTWGTTYAIHGNNNANLIGQYVSAGCIRMHNNEVQWLYNRVPVNTPVIITTSGKSFTTLASANGFKVASRSTVPVSTTVLKKGSRGTEVKNLQKRLTELGYSTNGIDGIFGHNTDAAVRKFQKAKKLKVDGVVGPATQKALGKI